MPTYDEIKNELPEIARLVVEFPDVVRPQVYELLISQFVGLGATASTVRQNAFAVVPRPMNEKKDKASVRKGSSKESYSVDRNLDLRGNKNLPSFKEFFEDKRPKSAQEFNAVAVYYLKRILELEAATLDQAYTCYKEVGQKQPKAFKQSFIDTKNRAGWIEFDAVGNLLIPHRGVAFVETDLPHEKTRGDS